LAALEFGFRYLVLIEGRRVSFRYSGAMVFFVEQSQPEEEELQFT